MRHLITLLLVLAEACHRLMDLLSPLTHAVMLAEQGDVDAWGSGVCGQLGHGHLRNETIPCKATYHPSSRTLQLSPHHPLLSPLYTRAVSLPPTALQRAHTDTLTLYHHQVEHLPQKSLDQLII